jgi:hypothetical protein
MVCGVAAGNAGSLIGSTLFANYRLTWVAPSNETEVSKRLFDSVIVFRRAWFDATAPTGTT